MHFKINTMKGYRIYAGMLSILILVGCRTAQDNFDATGSFEADEVVVSSEVSGKILSLSLQEGSVLAKDSIVGSIDPIPLQLQRAQVEASMAALEEKTLDAAPQIKLLQQQLNVQATQLKALQHEEERFAALVKADAATQKQLDDIRTQIDVLQQQILVTKQQVLVLQTTIATQNRAVLSEQVPLQKRREQVADQEKRSKIANPVAGTVITQYARAGEVTAAGKALYKVADLSTMNLRVYITGTQLSNVKLGQTLRVFADQGANAYKEYKGVVYWVADKAEFTPKTIQTKEERANLVYAVKLRVSNDGFLKIGMFGAVTL